MKKCKNIVSIFLFFTALTCAKSQTLPDVEFVNIPSCTFTIGEEESEYEGLPGSYDTFVHSVTLTDFQCDNIASGVYIYRIGVKGKFSSVKKMLLLK